MAFTWPKDLDFTPWDLDVIDRECPSCGRMMHICDHRQRRLYTLDGPVELICKLNHCPDPHCPGHAKTKSPEQESLIALPHWAIGWDVLCWIGQRRFSRHWAIPQIRLELDDAYAIKISEDSIARAIRSYQVILAARQQDPDVLRRQYAPVDEIILSIDGLQPEKGHETLYVVRELTRKRVWFAEPLISATDDEVLAIDRHGQGVGPVVGQGREALDLGQARGVRQGDRGGIPGGPPPPLRQPFPAGSGRARPGSRQPCQGADAKEGAWLAGDREGRAGAPTGRGRGTGAGDGPGIHRGRGRWAGGERMWGGPIGRRGGPEIL